MEAQLISIFSHRMALVTEDCNEVVDSCASAPNANRCNIPRQTFLYMIESSETLRPRCAAWKTRARQYRIVTQRLAYSIQNYMTHNMLFNIPLLHSVAVSMATLTRTWNLFDTRSYVSGIGKRPQSHPTVCGFMDTLFKSYKSNQN